jgi:DNA-binding FadR family transcriptional regulator
MSGGQTVLTGLRDLMENGLGEEGRLPSERQLSEMLQLGRPSIREQLQTLEVVGLLQRHRGRGTFVQPLQGDMLGAILDLALIAQRVSSEDLLVVRGALEREAARLAAGRLDRDSVARLRECCREMRILGSPDHGVQADLEFHRLILASCGNGALTFFGNVLSSALQRTLVARRKAISGNNRAVLEMGRAHQRLLDALVIGDAAISVRAMEEHFLIYDQVARRVERLAGQRARSHPRAKV